MADRSLQFNVFGRASTQGFYKAAAEVDFLAGRLRTLRDQRVNVRFDYDRGFFNKIHQGLDITKAGLMTLQQKGSAALSSLGSTLTSFASSGSIQLGLLTLALVTLAPALVLVAGLVAGLAVGLAAIAAISLAGIGIGFLGAVGPAVKLFKAVQGGNKEIDKLPKGLRAGARAARSFVDTFKNWGTQFEAPVGKIVETFSNLGKKVLPLFKPVVDGVLKATDNLAQKMGKALEGPIFRKFFDMLGTTGVSIFEKIGTAAGKFGTGLISLLTQSAPFADSLATKIERVADSFLKWTQSAKGQKDVQEFFAWVKKNGPDALETLKNVGQRFWEFLKVLEDSDSLVALQGLANALITIIALLESLTKGAKESVKAILRLIDVIGNLPGVGASQSMGGGTAGGLDFSGLLQSISAGMDLAKQVVSIAWSVIQQRVATGVNNVVGAVAAMPGRVSAALASLPGIVISRVNSAFSPLASIVSAASGRIVSIVGGMAAAVGGHLSGLVSRAYSTGAGFANGISSGMSRAVSSARSAASSIAGAINNIGGNAFGAGARIGDMLASGIRSGIAKVRAAASALADAAGKFFPGSPVREGPLRSLNRGHSGGMIAKMLADGIRANTGYVSSAANAMANSASSNISGGLSVGSGGSEAPGIVVYATLSDPVDVDILASRLGFATRGYGWV